MPYINNLDEILMLKIVHDIVKMVSDLDNDIFGSLKAEYAMLTTGRLCKDGLTLHQFALLAKDNGSAVSDNDFTLHYSIVRSMNVGTICYDMADVNVDHVKHHVYIEVNNVIKNNAITEGELYEVRRREFANTGTMLVQHEGQKERGTEGKRDRGTEGQRERARKHQSHQETTTTN